MLGIMGFGLLVLLWDWPEGPLSAFSVSCIGVAVLMVRVMPWHFEVHDEGLLLWFAFGRRRFLYRDDITVRVNPGSPVVLFGASRRLAYPLPDGFVERRRAVLRSVLIECGYRVA